MRKSLRSFHWCAKNPDRISWWWFLEKMFERQTSDLLGSSSIDSMHQRMSFLSNLTTPEVIQETFGLGFVGSSLLICQHLLWNTECFLYGGFVRDFIVRGTAHSDIDVGIRMLPSSEQTQSAFPQVIEAERVNLKFSYIFNTKIIIWTSLVNNNY